jgi:hypothetical protein
MVYRQKRYKRQKLIYSLPQVKNTKSLKQDRRIKALGSGKRKSKRGKTYWETRSNRSDKRGKLI